MRYVIVLFATVIYGCESREFEKDKRQVMAKDEIRRQVRERRSFDVIAFNEDTLQTYTDSNYRNPIRYTLDFVFDDSTGTQQKQRGIVLFTPDGKSIIHSEIVGEFATSIMKTERDQ